MNDFLQNLRNGQAEKQRPQKTRKSYDNSYHYTNPRFHSYGGYQSNRNQPQMKRPSSSPSQEGNQPQGDDNLVTSLLAEAIENLSNHVEILTTNQDYLVKAQEKTARMLERQVNAVERLLNHFNIAPLKVKKEKIVPGKKEKSQKDIPSKRVFKNHYVTSKQSKSDIRKPDISFSKTPDKKSDKRSDKPSAKISDTPPVKKAAENIKSAKPVLRKRKKIVEKKIAQTASADSNNKLLGRDAVMNIIHTMRTEGATFDQVAARLIELGQPTFSGRGEWHAQTVHRLCSK